MIRCSSCRTENDDSSDNCIACGKGLYALTRGAVLSGRYEILDAIGKGGMGVVYKARDLVLDETIALKVMRSDLAGSAEAAKRFRSEIKLARKVTHPNVCRMHDCGQEGHLTYIAMELIGGTDLKHELWRRGGLAPEEALDLVVQVAHGLDAVHRQGIVHRDLKTPNIMRMADGTAKLMDFGIAKSFAGDATTGATAAGSVLGTPEYMSPEQARGAVVDVRSDLYALGIVLFELLTGELPFHGDTPMATLLKQMHEPPPLDGPRAEKIPRLVAPVLRKALAKDPAARYASVQEMIVDLEKTREALAAKAPSSSLQPTQYLVATTRVPSTSVAPGTPPRRRVPWLVWATAGVVAVAVGVEFVKAQRKPLQDPTAAKVAATATLPEDAARVAVSSTPGVTIVSRTSPQAKPSPAALLRTPARTPRPTPSSATKSSSSALGVPPTATPPAIPATATGTAASVGPEATGTLRVDVKPYAEVFVDGKSLGTTPLGVLSLPAGAHTVRLIHPAFQPLQRKFTIRSGDLVDLNVDLALDAIPK